MDRRRCAAGRTKQPIPGTNSLFPLPSECARFTFALCHCHMYRANAGRTKGQDIRFKMFGSVAFRLNLFLAPSFVYCRFLLLNDRLFALGRKDRIPVDFVCHKISYISVTKRLGKKMGHALWPRLAATNGVAPARRSIRAAGQSQQWGEVGILCRVR